RRCDAGPGHALRRARPAGGARVGAGPAVGGSPAPVPDHRRRGRGASPVPAARAVGGERRPATPGDAMSRALVRLYPRWWRERYGEEFEVLLHDLSTDGFRRVWIMADVARDAARTRVGTFFADPAIRRGIYDGLIITALLAVDIVLTNVVFPQG